MTEWLREHVHGFKGLQEGILNAVSEFTLLWMVLENRALDTYATAPLIVEKVDALGDGAVNEQALEAPWKHFTERYLTDGAPNEKFDGLNFRNGDRRDVVVAILTDANANSKNRLKALLLILYRLRCNLFHGIKWSYKLHDQEPNLRHACNVMQVALTSFNALGE